IDFSYYKLNISLNQRDNPNNESGFKTNTPTSAKPTHKPTAAIHALFIIVTKRMIMKAPNNNHFACSCIQSNSPLTPKLLLKVAKSLEALIKKSNISSFTSIHSVDYC